MADTPQPPEPPMSTREALQRVIDHCDRRWTAAHAALATLKGASDPSDEQFNAEKAAYNDVYQFAQTLLHSLP